MLNTYTYTFDGIGNRTDRNYAANSLNQYKKNPDAGNADIDYDLRGNMITDGVFDFTWNSANQLTSATPRTVVTLEQEATAHDNGEDLPASRKVEFGYDDAGRRIWKKSYVYSSAANAWLANQTRKFVYDGDNLVADFVSRKMTPVPFLGAAASAWLARETRKFVYDGNNLVADFVSRKMTPVPFLGAPFLGAKEARKFVYDGNNLVARFRGPRNDPRPLFWPIRVVAWRSEPGVEVQCGAGGPQWATGPCPGPAGWLRSVSWS